MNEKASSQWESDYFPRETLSDPFAPILDGDDLSRAETARAAWSRRSFIRLAASGMASAAVIGGVGAAGSARAADGPAAAGAEKANVEKANSDVAAKASAQPIPDKEPQPPGKRLGWALVGIGDLTLKELLPAFGHSKNCKLTALVSGDPQKAARVAQDHGVDPGSIYDYANFDKIKDNPAVDVIYIVLPNALHAEYVVRGAKAGKHIFCEKPMATSMADAEKMIAACNEAGKKLMIAYRSQFEPHNLEAIRLVKSGELGKLKTIVADHGFNLDPKEPRAAWRFNKALSGGGPLMDIGIYSLQACRYLTGEEPTEVQAMMYSTPGDERFKEVEETVHFSLRFPGGALANCSASYNWAGTKRVLAMGDKGYVDLTPATAYGGNRLFKGGDSTREEKTIESIDQFAAEMDHFSDCIVNEKPVRCPGEEGLQDVRILLAVYEAAKTGGTLKLPAVKVEKPAIG